MRTTSFESPFVDCRISRRPAWGKPPDPCLLGTDVRFLTARLDDRGNSRGNHGQLGHSAGGEGESRLWPAMNYPWQELHPSGRPCDRERRGLSSPLSRG